MDVADMDIGWSIEVYMTAMPRSKMKRWHWKKLSMHLPEAQRIYLTEMNKLSEEVYSYRKYEFGGWIKTFAFPKEKVMPLMQQWYSDEKVLQQVRDIVYAYIQTEEAQEEIRDSYQKLTENDAWDNKKYVRYMAELTSDNLRMLYMLYMKICKGVNLLWIANHYKD